MKTKIQTALLNASNDLKDPWFCRIALHGGYEIFLRDILFYELHKIQPGEFDIEIEYENLRFDLIEFDSKKEIKSIIQLGHNGTWQGAKSVVNHAIENINNCIIYGLDNKEIYTASIVTDIRQLNSGEIFRIPRSYRGGTESNIKKKWVKIIEIEKLFKKLDKNYCKVKFSSSWNLFSLDVNIFICGPFDKLIDKETIFNAH